MLVYKIHKSKHGEILAVADEELLNKKLKFNGLDFWVNPRFYGETKASEEWLTKVIQEKTFLAINLIGDLAVNLGLKLKIIDKDKILKIGNIPHAHCILIF
ncbi:MAG: DUF424 family protein [Candidatus Nanoarchaeia archaeon]